MPQGHAYSNVERISISVETTDTNHLLSNFANTRGDQKVLDLT